MDLKVLAFLSWQDEKYYYVLVVYTTQLTIQKPLQREVQVVPPLKSSCVSVVTVGNHLIPCLHIVTVPDVTESFR